MHPRIRFKKTLALGCLVLACLAAPAGRPARAQAADPSAADSATLAQRQQAAAAAARAALEAPLPAAPAQPAPAPARSEHRLGRHLIVILLVLVLAAVVTLIFRIPQAAGSGKPAGRPAASPDGREPPPGKSRAEAAPGQRLANPRFLPLAAEQRVISPTDAADLGGRFRGNEFAALLYLITERPELKNRLGKAWGDSIGFAYLDLETTVIQPEAVRQISREFAETHLVIPLYSFGGNLSVAAANPGDRNLETRVFEAFNLMPSFTFALPDDIADAIAVAYQSAEELQAAIAGLGDGQGRALAKAQQEAATTEDLYRQANSSQVIEFVNGLILLAMNEMASDIHIEPDELSVRVRFRVDGILQEKFILDNALLPPLISRLKIMAGCDIAEKRLPQDGRIKFAMARRKVDMRFSTVPTLYGEKVVLRLLGSTFARAIPNLDEMDFSAAVLEAIKRVARSPNGVFFITGPTGSGKTTTLYSVLKYINTPGVNIMTVEDPVEYRLAGINQVQVNTAIALDFVRVLRAFLRQDPNVILIGEIRDIESARIASQAALTGHLVFATMHTNNALQAVSRMIDIGVEPFLVAPSLIALMAQRLVRRICPHCKEKYPAPRETLDDNFEWDGTTEVFFHRGKGCPRCRGTGFLGRLAIHEIFIINSETRAQIARNASIMAVEEIALKSGFKPLRYDGLKKVLRGLTTIEEVDRVTYADVE